MFLEPLAQNGQSLFGFDHCGSRRFTQSRGVTRRLLLELNNQRPYVFVQSTGGAILRFCKGTFQSLAEVPLRGVELLGDLLVPGSLRSRQRDRHLLLKFGCSGVECRALRFGCVFPLACCFFQRAHRSFCTRDNMRFCLVHLGSQPSSGLFGLLASGLQGLCGGFQSLCLFSTLRDRFLRKPGGQIAGELFQLGSQPSWQLRPQSFCSGRMSLPRVLVGFLLEFFNCARGFIGNFRAPRGKLLFPLLERETPLDRDRFRSRFPRCRLNLLPGIGDQPGHLAC